MDQLEPDAGGMDSGAERNPRAQQHAHRKIGGLCVRQVGTKVVLFGRASSDPVLQVALAAARELAGNATVEVHVEISPAEIKEAV